MEKLLQLRQERAQLIKQSRDAFEAFKESKDPLDRDKYENIEKAIEEKEFEIAAEEKDNARSQELEKQTEATVPKQIKETAPYFETDAYAEAFDTYLRSGGRVLESEGFPVREDITDGNYLAPTNLYNQIVMKKKEQFVMRRLATVLTFSSDTNVPLEGSSGSAGWIDGGSSYPTGDVGVSRHSFGAHKIGRIVKVNEETLADSAFDVQAYLTNIFSRTIGEGEETAFFIGNGLGTAQPTDRPHGFLADAQEAKEMASASAITYDEILDAYYGVNGAYRANGSFIFNSSTLKAVRQLKDGSGNWLFRPGDRVDTIEGRPVYTSDEMPELGTNSVPVVAFGDFSMYYIIDRRGFFMQRLDQTFAADGQIGFKGMMRTDGKLLFNDAVKVLNTPAA
jgi:HK97 family phage major capsid protein